ncbi:MAG: CDP-archaeol synthase [Verrucomicrobiota bacterium]
MFRQRFFSWLILWSVTLGIIFIAPPWVDWTILTLVGLWGQGEFYHAQHAKGIHVYKKMGLLFGLLWFLGIAFFMVHRPELSSWLPFYFLGLLSLMILTILSRHVLFYTQSPNPIAEQAGTLMGFFYVPVLFGYVGLIDFMNTHRFDTSMAVLYLLAVTKFTDVGAYVVGKLIGKHKMIPHISPGKTWEGFCGGVAISTLLSVGLAHSIPGLELLQGMHAWILGILISLGSVIGDLAESVVKRDAHVKDSGHAIPGIGGILDLIDSLIFTAPILYLYLKLLPYLHG